MLKHHVCNVSNEACVNQSDEILVCSFRGPGVVGPITVWVIELLEFAEPPEEELDGRVLFEG